MAAARKPKKKVALPTEPRVQLAIYRLKPPANATIPFADAIDAKNNKGVKTLAADLGQSVHAQVVVRHPPPELPKWVPFLEQATTGLPNLLTENAANSAALIVVQNRVRYAIVFGYGRALLEPAAIERGFGLRVALALIDPASVISIGFKEVDYTTFYSNRQSNRRVRFRDFRVDITSALLSGVVGNPATKEVYFTKALGADPLHINPAIRIVELPTVLTWVEKIYQDKKYRTLGYDWIDRVTTVRDPARVIALEAQLDAELKRSAVDIFLGPPEHIDHERITTFSIVGLRKEHLDELSVADVARAQGAVTVDVLKKTRIQALDDQGEVVRTWPAFEWVAWSHASGGKTILLQAGTFFEIEASFEVEIDNYLKKNKGRVPTTWPDFAPTTADSHEDEYNEALAKTIGAKATLLDKVLVQETLAGRGALEVCDVLVRGPVFDFVSVKKYSGSSSPLSHLFAQGLNGVIALLEDDKLRAEASKLKVKRGTMPDVTNLDPSECVISLLVLTKEKRRSITTLPFFAKLTLFRAIKEAKQRGLSIRFDTRAILSKTRRKKRKGKRKP